MSKAASCACQLPDLQMEQNTWLTTIGKDGGALEHAGAIGMPHGQA